jgi:uncharacterized protein with von Willebrand factor type A (vWA) domain
MADPRALTRVVDELLWSLRRAGLVVSTAQAIDAARAIAAVGLEDRAAVKDALASIVVHRRRDRATFDEAFDDFFGEARGRDGDLFARLARHGLSVAEIDEVRSLIAAMARERGDAMAPLGALLERGAELDRLLYAAGMSGGVDAQSRLQLGFYTYRLLERIGAPRAHATLAALRSALADAFGPERADAVVAALKAELERTTDSVSAHVRATFDRREAAREREARTIGNASFTSLSAVEVDEVRRAVRSFAARLRGAARVRKRRALRGRIDPHRTLRRALRTAGVPFAPARKIRRRDKPRLVLLCDVSDSVRNVACFMLEMVYAAQELFERTRSFVFVSELGETTQLFATEPVSVALGRAYGGGVVSVHDNSNYGRVLRAFEQRHLDAVDHQTTVVVLGDGRTNYLDAAEDVLDRIRARARALVWLCPEPRAQWNVGDSAMARYAPKCSEVYEVRSASDLENAARALVHRR